MRTVAAVYRELIPDRRTDGELLAAFISERSEPAFIELVRRHGPLVWGACRRLLPDPADAEDAFQAAFLVLVRRAHQAARGGAVGPWLHRVAVWTARNARRKNARRLARQHALTEDAPRFVPDTDLRADIDGALLALPARYRDPIILCHLQGYSRREAAEHLGCAEGTLSAWLNRGLAKLRTRLRDFDPTKVLPVLAAGAVPAALAASTARAAAVSTVAAVTVTPAVSSIVEGVLHMLWIKKATAASFAMCAVFAMGIGVGLGTRPSYTGAVAQDGDPVTGTAAKPQNDPKSKPKPQPNSKPNPQSPAETLATVEKQAQAAQAELLRLVELRKQMDAEIAATNAEFQALRRYMDRAKGAEKPAAGSADETAAKWFLRRMSAEKPTTGLADEIAVLERAIRENEALHQNALTGVDAAKKKADITKSLPGADPKDVAEDIQTLERFQKNADDAKAAELKLRALKEEIAKLDKIENLKDLSALKEEIARLSKIEKPDFAKELKALKDEELVLRNKLKQAAELKTLKEEKLGVQNKIEKPAAAKEVAALEEAIRAKETQHQAFLAVIESTRAQLATTQRRFKNLQATGGANAVSEAREYATSIERSLSKIKQLQDTADETAAELKSLKEQLAKLKSTKPAQEPRPEKGVKEKIKEANENKDPNKVKEANQDRDLAELKRQIEVTAAMRERLLAQSKLTEKQIADAEAFLREYQRKVEAMLAEKKAEAAKNAIAGGGSYLEITIVGKGGAFEFSITEVPAGDGKGRGLQAKFGPVTTRDPAALALLLARAKKDTAGPQEVRVIVQPQTVLGAGPVAALEACDKAGYKTVKYTGYVFGGGFATELKADQKGDVRGYKRYEGTEVRPKELAEEITEGLRRL